MKHHNSGGKPVSLIVAKDFLQTSFFNIKTLKNKD